MAEKKQNLLSQPKYTFKDLFNNEEVKKEKAEGNGNSDPVLNKEKLFGKESGFSGPKSTINLSKPLSEIFTQGSRPVQSVAAAITPLQPAKPPPPAPNPFRSFSSSFAPRPFLPATVSFFDPTTSIFSSSNRPPSLPPTIELLLSTSITLFSAASRMFQLGENAFKRNIEIEVKKQGQNRFLVAKQIYTGHIRNLQSKIQYLPGMEQNAVVVVTFSTTPDIVKIKFLSQRDRDDFCREFALGIQ